MTLQLTSADKISYFVVGNCFYHAGPKGRQGATEELLVCVLFLFLMFELFLTVD